MLSNPNARNTLKTYSSEQRLQRLNIYIEYLYIRGVVHSTQTNLREIEFSTISVCNTVKTILNLLKEPTQFIAAIN